jgi:hypothetical protein
MSFLVIEEDRAKNHNKYTSTLSNLCQMVIIWRYLEEETI